MIEFDFWSSIFSISFFSVFSLLYFFLKKKPPSKIAFSDLSILGPNKLSLRIHIFKLLPLLKWSALILMLIAFSRPRLGKELSSYKKEGIVIQFVIDRSGSMSRAILLDGQKISRLDAVKKVFKKFVKGNEGKFKGRDNDLISVNTFARFVQENVPLTLDHDNLIHMVDSLKPATSNVDSATMIGDAIHYSALQLKSAEDLIKKRFSKSKAYKIKSKIMIVITDGEQSPGGILPTEGAKTGKKHNIKIYTIAIINSESDLRKSLMGSFFGVNNEQALDTTELENVAKLTGGFFAKANSGEDLLKIYKKIDQLEKSSFEQKITIYRELFQYFLWAALILFFLEFILSNTFFIKIS